MPLAPLDWGKSTEETITEVREHYSTQQFKMVQNSLRRSPGSSI